MAARAAYERALELARSAERAGDNREALRLYTVAHRQVNFRISDAEDDSIHARIFRLAGSLRPPPAFPDSAFVHQTRAQMLFDSATSPEDFRRVAMEFGDATLIAPWSADLYFNGAVALERGGDLLSAARFFRIYLLSPNIDDREAVRRRLIGLELALERTAEKYRAFDPYLGAWVTTAGEGIEDRVGTLLPLTRRGDTLFFGDDAKRQHRGVIRGSNWGSVSWSGPAYVHAECRALFSGQELTRIDVQANVRGDETPPALSFTFYSANGPDCEMKAANPAEPFVSYFWDSPPRPASYSLTLGVVQRAELVPGQARDTGDGSLHHRWTFAGESGQRVRVKVQAYTLGFRPAVEVGLDDGGEFQRIWSGMGTRRSRYGFQETVEGIIRLKRSGTYAIHVRAVPAARDNELIFFYGVTGRYRISVEPVR